MPLTLKAAMEVEKNREVIDKWLEYLVRDPEVLKAMIKGTEKLLKEEKLPAEFKQKLVEMLKS